jgi:hypothetical protein
MATNVREALQNANEGTKVVITGNLEYAKYMTQVLQGDELAKEVAREEQYSKHPEFIMRDPKIRFSLGDPKCQKQGDKPSELEQAFMSKVYTRKDGTTALDYERRAPKRKDGTYFVPITFGVKGADGKIHKVNLAGKDLANDQKVTLTYEVYKAKMGKGLALRTVVFEEEPKLFQPNLPDGWVDDGDEPADSSENGVGDDLFS